MKLNTLSVSVIAIAAAGPALAFDGISWNWDSKVTSAASTAASSAVSVHPSGLAKVESDQIASGEYVAFGSTTGVVNDAVSLNGIELDDVAAVATQATSLANNASLDADVSTQFDMNQSYSGTDLTVGTSLTGTLVDVSLPGLVAATATTSGVLNGTVDNAATSVVNNMTATLATDSLQDAFLIGNNVQVANAMTSSTSMVDTVAFNNVSGLGTLVDPVVSSVATALGNNLSVTVDGIN